MYTHIMHFELKIVKKMTSIYMENSELKKDNFSTKVHKTTSTLALLYSKIYYELDAV